MFGTLDDATLVDQFDLVIDITSEEQNIDIHTFMKSQNVHDEKSTISFLEMLKNKLRHARQLQVTLSPEARQLLKAYFLANRKLREFGPYDNRLNNVTTRPQKDCIFSYNCLSFSVWLDRQASD
jgi:DNA replicative helicase MCM subunit Mcm2 (Cdc46/Mcm family)